MRASSYLPRSASSLLHICLFCAAFLQAAPLPSQVVLVPPDELWKYFKGTEEPPADWNTRDFNDGLWADGQSGFGYADGDDITVLDDMINNYVSVYIRHAFEVPQPSQIVVLQLGIQWDDGFVAYLNGVELARANMPGAVGTPVLFNAFASPEHEVNTAPVYFTARADALNTLQQGRNVIAIQCHNVTLASSDLSLIPQLRYYQNVCPTTLTCTQPTPASVRLSWGVVVSPPPFDAVDVVRDGTVIGMPSAPTSRTYTDASPPPGEHVYEVVATVRGTRCSGNEVPRCTVTVAGAAEQFRRGDADRDRQINLTDPLLVLNFLFLNGAAPGCPDSADADDNGQLQLTDALYILNALFVNGPEPKPPGPTTCGPDPTNDTLGACTYTSC